MCSLVMIMPVRFGVPDQSRGIILTRFVVEEKTVGETSCHGLRTMLEIYKRQKILEHIHQFTMIRLHSLTTGHLANGQHVPLGSSCFIHHFIESFSGTLVDRARIVKLEQGLAGGMTR